MLFYVFCELDFDKILLLHAASQPEPQTQITWKMQQKTHFPIYNDKLEPVCALQTTLLSAQQAGTLATYPRDVAPVEMRGISILVPALGTATLRVLLGQLGKSA